MYKHDLCLACYYYGLGVLLIFLAHIYSVTLCMVSFITCVSAHAPLIDGGWPRGLSCSSWSIYRIPCVSRSRRAAP